MTIDTTKKILIIVESPNKKATITDIVKKAGYKKVQVMASVGHIMKLADDKSSWKNTGIWPEQDFKPNLVIAPDKEKVVKDIQTQAAIADYIFVASDGDREGEVIAWSLLQFAILDSYKSKCYRMIMHEITPKAVVHALENPVTFDKYMVESGLTRWLEDKFYGYGLSPIAKAYLGAKSVGRCQSAGLRLIVDREKEILNFIPEHYYDLYLDFVKGKDTFRAKYIGTADNKLDHLKSKNDVIKVANECIGDYKISDIVKKIKKENPKPPFCTSTFQQEVASKLNLSVKSAQACAQELYTGIEIGGNHVGLITYIRTDATDMSPEFLPILKDYIESTYGKGTFNTPKVGKKDDNAQDGHECLRCTDPTMTPEKLAKYIKNDLLLKVYRIIWQRTIAAAMPAAQISETSYIINNNGHLFSLVSNELVEPGYRQIYSYRDEDDEKEEVLKTTFKKNEVLKDCSLDGQEKSTKPKPRYKEATFIKELQARGIGRPSTFATILSTVTDASRGYCQIVEKELVPTKRGIELIEYLSRAFPEIVDLNYTKHMEEELDKIAAGKLTRGEALTEFFTKLVTSINKNTEFAAQGGDIKCPKCGKTMVLRRNKWGKNFYGCSDYPNCNGIVNCK